MLGLQFWDQGRFQNNPELCCGVPFFVFVLGGVVFRFPNNLEKNLSKNFWKSYFLTFWWNLHWWNYWADYQFEEINYVDLVFCCVVHVFSPSFLLLSMTVHQYDKWLCKTVHDLCLFDLYGQNNQLIVNFNLCQGNLNFCSETHVHPFVHPVNFFYSFLSKNFIFWRVFD
jgi:hypothetical protein